MSIRDLFNLNKKRRAVEELYAILKKNPNLGLELDFGTDPLLEEIVVRLLKVHPECQIIQAERTGKATLVFKDQLYASDHAKAMAKAAGMLKDREDFHG